MQTITNLGILCLGFSLAAALAAATQAEKPALQFTMDAPGGSIFAEMQTDQTEAQSVSHSRVSVVSYDSSILKESRHMCIYTPPGYKEGGDRYPVLYLLHSEGGDENEWITLGEANLIIDNLIAQKKAEPMIAVMPNGNANQKMSVGTGPMSQQASSAQPRPPGGKDADAKSSATPAEELFSISLAKEIVPYVKKHYRVEDKMESRAIAGLSMGGGQTITATALYPRTFGYIGVWSAGTRLTDDQLRLRLSLLRTAGIKLYYVGCGVDDQLAHAGSMRLVEQLKKLDMWYRFKETPGGRTWSNWRTYLSDFTTQLFK